MTAVTVDLCSTCSNMNCASRTLVLKPVENCSEYIPFVNLPKVNYDTLHETFDKWFLMSDKAKMLLDVELAIYLANETDYVPLWIIVRGASGDLKSGIANGLIGCPRILEVNDLSTSAFVTGSKKSNIDIGRQLQGRHRVIAIRDLSALITLHRDEKRSIFGKMRTLYDGFLKRNFGNGVVEYKDIKCNIIMNSTNIIQNEMLLHQALGTRELQFDTDAIRTDNNKKMDRAISNNNKLKQMDEEIKNAMHGYLAHHRFDYNIKLPPQMKKWLKEQANELTLMRAEVTIDSYTGEVIDIPTPEVPTRLIQQFDCLYKALKSLNSEYTDTRIKEIIRHIAKSSGVVIRSKIYNGMKGRDKEVDSIVVAQNHKLGYKRTRTELDRLWSLGLVDRYRIEEGAGNFVQYHYYYKISRRGVQHTVS